MNIGMLISLVTLCSALAFFILHVVRRDHSNAWHAMFLSMPTLFILFMLVFILEGRHIHELEVFVAVFSIVLPLLSLLVRHILLRMVTSYGRSPLETLRHDIVSFDDTVRFIDQGDMNAISNRLNAAAKFNKRIETMLESGGIKEEEAMVLSGILVSASTKLLKMLRNALSKLTTTHPITS